MRKACEGNRDLALIGPEARAIFLSQNPAAEVKPLPPPLPAPAAAGVAPQERRPRPLQ